MNRLVLALFLLALSAQARAELPLLSSTERAPPTAAFVLLGTDKLGLGGSLRNEPDERPHSYIAELNYAYRDHVLQLSAARLQQVTAMRGPDEHSVFNFAGQLGVNVLTTLKGPLHLGLGPQMGVSLGLGGDRVHGFLGLQAGAEVFPVGGAPWLRAPLRVVLGGAVRLFGPLHIMLFGRGGVDLFPKHFATIRYEASLALGWALPTGMADSSRM